MLDRSIYAQRLTEAGATDTLANEIITMAQAAAADHAKTMVHTDALDAAVSRIETTIHKVAHDTTWRVIKIISPIYLVCVGGLIKLIFF